MSKVKDFTGHEKEKLRHSLRRKESHQKIDERIKAAKGKAYGFGRGYWIKDEKRETEKIYEVIPAHRESVKKVTGYVDHRTYWYDDDGYAHPNGSYRLPVYTYETIDVPESVVLKKKRTVYLQTEPRLRRICVRKKWYKKMAAKAARKVALSNGGSYKKAYDIFWEIW